MAIDQVRITDENAIKSKQNEEDVMEFYHYSAEKGDTQAQLLMGYAHLYGMRGIEQNYQIARQYFTRALSNGDPAAYGPMGQIYSQGLGVVQNNKTALHYFRQGADKGDPASHNGIGYMYMYGLAGLQKDYAQAVKHFNISASEGNNPEAQYNLGVLYMSKFILFFIF